MGFKTFEEIEAWQCARTLMGQVRKYCKRAFKKKEWSWADQVTRASLSIMANIAEGHDAQTNPEFIVFLGYAKRSAAEVRSHLFYGLDEGLISEKEFFESDDLARKIGAQLAKLITYLRKNDTKVRGAQQKKSSNELTSNEQRSSPFTIHT